MTNTRLQQARDFLYRDARLLESRLFAVQFEGAAPDGVVDALLGYRNPDGGFGHALEPDKRSPVSQPLDVQFAFETLVEAGVAPEDVILGACDFLEAVSTSEGMVPLALPGIADYPRAPHWSADPYPPDLNPTAALVALLYRLGVEHAWRDRAAEGCFAALEGGSLGDAHAILCVLKFLQWVPDRSRAERLTPRVAAALPTAEWFRSDADRPGLRPAPDPIRAGADEPLALPLRRRSVRGASRPARSRPAGGRWVVDHVGDTGSRGALRVARHRNAPRAQGAHGVRAHLISHGSR